VKHLAPSAITGGLSPGTILGKYEILRAFARGGMAELYLARPCSLPGFEKLIAVKRVLPELAGRRDVVEMFLDEARLAATLEHPNVIQTHDVGIVDGSYFMAMEFLHGENLNTILRTLEEKKRRLAPEIAIDITIKICAGLHYAHEKHGSDGKSIGIVHRDVTPQNVIVTYEGGVKLVDFGVAKAATHEAETRYGTIKGKLAYLSPEQCRCEELDRRSDLFSLGILLYEMTLGRRPFQGPSDIALIKQIEEQPVAPPRTIDPNYPEALERVVMRALERDRENRPQTALQLGEELEGAARELGLFLSSQSLVKFMEELFSKQVAAWRLSQSATTFEQIESLSSMALVEMPDPGDDVSDRTRAVSESMVEMVAWAEPKIKARGEAAGPLGEPPARTASFWSVVLGSLAAAVIVVLVIWLMGGPGSAR
jgi:serine/threonine protein kinase